MADPIISTTESTALSGTSRPIRIARRMLRQGTPELVIDPELGTFVSESQYSLPPSNPPTPTHHFSPVIHTATIPSPPSPLQPFVPDR